MFASSLHVTYCFGSTFLLQILEQAIPETATKDYFRAALVAFFLQRSIMMMFYFPVELKTSVFGESFGSALNHSSFSTEATLKIGPKSEEMSYPDLVRRWQRMTNYSV